MVQAQEPGDFWRQRNAGGTGVSTGVGEVCTETASEGLSGVPKASFGLRRRLPSGVEVTGMLFSAASISFFKPCTDTEKQIHQSKLTRYVQNTHAHGLCRSGNVFRLLLGPVCGLPAAGAARVCRGFLPGCFRCCLGWRVKALYRHCFFRLSFCCCCLAGAPSLKQLFFCGLEENSASI